MFFFEEKLLLSHQVKMAATNHYIFDQKTNFKWCPRWKWLQPTAGTSSMTGLPLEGGSSHHKKSWSLANKIMIMKIQCIVTMSMTWWFNIMTMMINMTMTIQHNLRSGRAQPDSREGDEACMAVLNNFYGDGILIILIILIIIIIITTINRCLRLYLQEWNGTTWLATMRSPLSARTTRDIWGTPLDKICQLLDISISISIYG